MKKFAFRLQRVLDHRNSLKKEKEQALAKRNAELQTAEERLIAVREAHDSSPTTGEGHLTMAQLQLEGGYRDYLQEALMQQQLYVLEAAGAVEEARDAYIEKAVEAETLETLKKKKLQEHQDEQKKAERKSMDNMTVQRHRFKKQE